MFTENQKKLANMLTELVSCYLKYQRDILSFSKNRGTSHSYNSISYTFVMRVNSRVEHTFNISFAYKNDCIVLYVNDIHALNITTDTKYWEFNDAINDNRNKNCNNG